MLHHRHYPRCSKGELGLTLQYKYYYVAAQIAPVAAQKLHTVQHRRRGGSHCSTDCQCAHLHAIEREGRRGGEGRGAARAASKQGRLLTYIVFWRIDQALWRICKALLRIYRALLRIYRALLQDRCLKLLERSKSLLLQRFQFGFFSHFYCHDRQILRIGVCVCM